MDEVRFIYSYRVYVFNYLLCLLLVLLVLLVIRESILESTFWIDVNVGRRDRNIILRCLVRWFCMLELSLEASHDGAIVRCRFV